MNFLKQAERKLGRFAIRNVTLYLVGGQGLALVLGLTAPGFLSAIQLFPTAVMAGQWWRLLSFLFTPPLGNPIFAIFTLYLLYFMGAALEAHWKTFRYNLYVLIGYLLTIAAAFVFPFSIATNVYITGSIFLAFAYLFPDYQINLFLILPVRIKWLALLTWLYYAFEFVIGDGSSRLLILAAVANFFLFFGTDLFYKVRYGQRKIKMRASAIAARNQPIHVCAVCGITDKSDRMMDFRYCTKCEPPLAYCTHHLRTHQHLRNDAGQ